MDAKNPAPSNQVLESDIDVGDSTYHKKAKLLNSAIQETGMGRYQWYAVTLFSLSVRQDG